MRNRTALLLCAVTLLAAAVAVGATQKITLLMQAERLSEDFRTATLLPPEPQDGRVVIVALSEATLARFPYRAPVDRAFLAALLRTLAEKQPSVIALDVLFDQPTEPAKDALLKQVIATLGVPLVLSYSDDPAIVDKRQLAYLDAFDPAGHRGQADLTLDPVDGVVRWIAPGTTGPDGAVVPSVPRAIAAAIGTATPAQPVEMVWHGRPNRTTPPFPIYAAEMAGLLPAAWIRGKIVLIGERVSLTDRHRTPFTTVYGGAAGDRWGVDILAHATAQLVEGRQPQPLGPGAEAGLVLLLAALGSVFGLVNHGILRHLLLGAVTLALLWAAGFALFYASGRMAPLIAPSLAFLLATWGADAVTGRQARRQREFIQGAFGRYLSPQLVRQLAQEPDRLKLGGEMREMTLMFCDIRGFTELSEGMDAEQLTRFINRYLTPMTEAILAGGGTIDKYMGDAIMAFWNAPLDDAAHAAHACRSALAMRDALVRLNETLRSEADRDAAPFRAIRFGIALNTDICCVGNVGSDQRFDYSVLGDGVNLCSRLEGQTKTYGVDIIVGERTAAAAAGLALLELDLVRVLGKSRPLRIHALLGDEGLAANPAFVALRQKHDAMIAAYRARQWPEARTQLAACRAEGPELMQPFYRLCDERIARFAASPPPRDWDGIHVALNK